MLMLCCSAALGQGARYDGITLNGSGGILTGASVYVCTDPTSGTPCTPLASLYSDPALSQSLSNPLSSDASGKFYFYALPGNYMLQVYNGPTLLYTLDNVSVTSSAVADKGGQVFSVIAYGATGNGTTDDTSAVNSALSAASAGAIIYFPPGIYSIQSQISTITKSVTLSLAPGATLTLSKAIAVSGVTGFNIVSPGGSKITIADNSVFTAPTNNGTDGLAGYFMLQLTNVTNALISGVTLDGNRSNQAVTNVCYNGVGAYGVTNLTIQDSILNNWQRWAVFVTSDGQTSPSSGSSSEVSVIYNGANNDGTPTANSQCNIAGGDGGAVGLQNGSSSTSASNYVVGWNTMSTDFMAVDALPQSGSVFNVSVVGNTISSGTSTGFEPGSMFIENGNPANAGFRISGNYISCASTQSGVYIVGMIDLDANGNYTSGCGRGWQFDATGQNISHISFRGNHANGTGVGFFLDSSGTNSISDFNMDDNVVSGSVSNAVTVSVLGGSVNLTLGANSFSAATTPTSNTGGTINGAWQSFTGFVTLSSGTGTITAPAAFSSSSTWRCVGTDTTGTNVVGIATSTTTSATVTGTSSDVVAFVCSGY